MKADLYKLQSVYAVKPVDAKKIKSVDKAIINHL